MAYRASAPACASWRVWGVNRATQQTMLQQFSMSHGPPARSAYKGSLSPDDEQQHTTPLLLSSYQQQKTTRPFSQRDNPVRFAPDRDPTAALQKSPSSQCVAHFAALLRNVCRAGDVEAFEELMRTLGSKQVLARIVNAKDRSTGRTALHFAAIARSSWISRRLLQLGANGFAVDAARRTAADYVLLTEKKHNLLKLDPEREVTELFGGAHANLGYHRRQLRTTLRWKHVVLKNKLDEVKNSVVRVGSDSNSRFNKFDNSEIGIVEKLNQHLKAPELIPTQHGDEGCGCKGSNEIGFIEYKTTNLHSQLHFFFLQDWMGELCELHGIPATSQTVNKVRGRNLHLTTFSGPGAVRGNASHQLPDSARKSATTTGSSGILKVKGRNAGLRISHRKARELGGFAILSGVGKTSGDGAEKVVPEAEDTRKKAKAKRPLTVLEKRLIEEEKSWGPPGDSKMIARSGRGTTPGSEPVVKDADDHDSHHEAAPKPRGRPQKNEYAKFGLLAQRWLEYFERKSFVLDERTVLVGARVKVEERLRTLPSSAKSSASRKMEDKNHSPGGAVLLEEGIILKETERMLEVVAKKDGRVRKYVKALVVFHLLLPAEAETNGGAGHQAYCGRVRFVRSSKRFEL
eukprot:g14794.t1